MNFGMEYGMEIESVKNEGTCVSITIPMEYFGEGEGS